MGFQKQVLKAHYPNGLGNLLKGLNTNKDINPTNQDFASQLRKGR